MSLTMGAGAVRPASALRTSATGRPRVVPVAEPLAALFPFGGIRRGSTVVVRGSTSVLFELMAAPMANGSWAAVVGLPDLGMAAAAECGVAVDRVALVPEPGAGMTARVLAALIGGMDLVVTAPQESGWLTQSQARRLSVRARQRESVLLTVGAWPGADLELDCTPGRWDGLDSGHGHLSTREIVISACGRGAAVRPVRTSLWLPRPVGGDGGDDVAPAVVEPEMPRLLA